MSRLAGSLAALTLLFSPLGPSRAVHPLLPWHAARLDGGGRLLAWYHPERNLGYDHVLRLGWNFLERKVPVDRRTGVPVYFTYAVFDSDTRQGKYWQHNPAFLNASLVDSLVAWYPYSGDRRAIDLVRRALDYQLARGTTPLGWSWPQVPFSTSCGGDRRYGRCFAGTSPRFYGGIEPDKVGLLGLGYLQFYELTGQRRFLRAAIHCGDALARHVVRGDATRTPWPFRVNARTGGVIGAARYGGAVAGPVRLLDELARLRVGHATRYGRARDNAWQWLLRYPLNPQSSVWNGWSGFYEDVQNNPGSRNQATPTITAHYLLTRDAPDSLDPDWQLHAQVLLSWVRSSFGRGPFYGAWGIDEQKAPGKAGCCSRVGLGSDTSRWAAMNALLYARTGDAAARENAFRSLNYATYFARSDGRVACCGKRSANAYWFSDGYGDYLRSFNWGMTAIPELAPARRDHLLGSTSVVQSVSYGKGRVAYRAFDRAATEVLRLSFRPARVVADGRLLAPAAAGNDTYSVQAVAGRDVVVRIRRSSSRRVVVSAR